MKRALLALVAATVLAIATIAVVAGTSASGSPEPGSTANRGQALADARARLRSFVPPPGSRRVASLPRSLHLNGPFWRPGSPRYVDVHADWISSESVASIRAYLAANAPPGARHSVSSGGWSGGHGSVRWDYGYSWPPLPNVADNRELLVGVVARPGGGSAMREDAEATYIEPKPKDERIPGGVGYLEATESLEGHGTRIVGTSSAAKIEAVSELLDRLPIIQDNGGVECGEIPSERVTLKAVLRATEDGPVLAETEQQLPAGYCDFIGLTIEGEEARGLFDEGGALTKSLQNLLARKYKAPLTADIEGF